MKIKFKRSSDLLNMLILMIIIVLLLSSCTNSRTIKIGFLGTVSGPNGNLALDGKHGADLAIKEINENGGVFGRMLELVVLDTLNDSEITKRQVNKFASENINIVIGEFTSALTKAALESEKAEKILFLSPTAAAESFVGLNDNLIRYIGSTSMQAKTIALQAKINGDKNFIIVKSSDNLEFVDTLADAFNDLLSADGGKIIATEYFTSAQVPIIHEVIEANFPENHEVDGILLLSDAYSTTLFIQDINKNNIKINIYTPLWANTTNLFSLGMKYNNGVHTLGFYTEELEKPAFTKFTDEYIKLFGSEPVSPSYFSYDTVMALYHAMLEVGKPQITNIAHLKKHLINTKVTSLLEDFRIDEFGDADREYASYIIIDGELTPFPGENQ